MANIKSSKKRAITNSKRHIKNLRRVSAVKTHIKKVVDAVQAKDIKKAQELLKLAEAKIAKASAKKVIKKNSASRKISKLAKSVALLAKSSK